MSETILNAPEKIQKSEPDLVTRALIQQLENTKQTPTQLPATTTKIVMPAPQNQNSSGLIIVVVVVVIGIGFLMMSKAEPVRKIKEVIGVED